MTHGPLVSFAIALVGARFLVWYARRSGILDVPNVRSSHTIPTPRGGGAALVAGVLVGATYELAAAGLPHGSLALLALASIALAVVGWLDDRHGLAISPRLAVHALCGFVTAALVNAITDVPSPLNAAWLLAWAFWVAASVNIVNFMDGIDGLVAAQGVVYGAFLAAIAPPDGAAGAFGLVLGSACLGFLVWNWAPAKIFMGDVGSGPLGLFFAVGGALALLDVSAFLVFLPLFPLYLDALATLIWRYRRGERITVAHRSHLYQRLADRGTSHALVTGAYVVASLVGVLMALALKDASRGVVASGVIAYCALIIGVWSWGHAVVAGSVRSSTLRRG